MDFSIKYLKSSLLSITYNFLFPSNSRNAIKTVRFYTLGISSIVFDSLQLFCVEKKLIICKAWYALLTSVTWTRHFWAPYPCRYDTTRIRVRNTRRHGTLLYGLVVLGHRTWQQVMMSKCSTKISTSLSFPDFAVTSRLCHSFHFTGFQTKCLDCRARDWTQKTLLIKTILALLDKLRVQVFTEEKRWR